MPSRESASPPAGTTFFSNPTSVQMPLPADPFDGASVDQQGNPLGNRQQFVGRFSILRSRLQGYSEIVAVAAGAAPNATNILLTVSTTSLPALRTGQNGATLNPATVAFDNFIFRCQQP